MNDADYFALDRLNASSLKQFVTSPAHYINSKINPTEPTTSMALGTLVHCLTLEPDAFDERYIVASNKLDRRTKAGKEEWAALQESDKIVIKQDTLMQATSMTASVLAHPVASRLLSASSKEQVALFDVNGVACKAKIDVLSITLEVADLKTTSVAHPDKFKWAVRDFKYGLQMAFYAIAVSECFNIHIYELPIPQLIVVERDAPHMCSVFSFEEAAWQNHIDECLDAIHAFSVWNKTDNDLFYSADVIDLEK